MVEVLVKPGAKVKRHGGVIRLGGGEAMRRGSWEAGKR